MKNKRCSLRCSLNAVNDEAEVTCSGSVFQMRAPVTGKALEPMEVSRTAGTIRSWEVEDRSLWQKWTSATRTNCRRYCGTSPVREPWHGTSGRQPCMLFLCMLFLLYVYLSLSLSLCLSVCLSLFVYSYDMDVCLSLSPPVLTAIFQVNLG